MPLENFNYLLSWADFQKKSIIPEGKDEFAQIHPELIFSNFVLVRKKAGVSISEVDVKISIVSDDCWVVSSKMNPELLIHEQRHYDIIALSARDFYNTVKSMVAKSVKDFQSKVTKLQETSQKDVREIDQRYDEDTDHSKDKKEQEVWNRKIIAVKNNPKGTLNDLRF